MKIVVCQFCMDGTVWLCGWYSNGIIGVELRMVGGTFWQLHSLHELSEGFGCERYVFHLLEAHTSKAYIIEWCVYTNQI